MRGKRCIFFSWHKETWQGTIIFGLSIAWSIGCLHWKQEGVRVERIGLKGIHTIMWNCWGSWQVAYMRIVHLIFFLLCVKLVFVWCFQSSQKPVICNLVSLLYSHFWLSVCGVWNGNRRAKITLFMVSHGLWSMIYTSEMPSLFQIKHWGKQEGSTMYCNTDLAQLGGCDAVGNGKGVCICKTQLYMLISAFNFRRFGITRREGFIICLCFVFFLFSLFLLVLWINIIHLVILLRHFLFLLPC